MMKIPFNKPFLGEEEINAVVKVIKSGWITSAKIGEEFEKKFATYVGSKHCILVNSCTSAIFLSLQYLKSIGKIKEGFTALVPSMTFAATATEVINAGGNVVFGDIDTKSMCLIPDDNIKYDVALPVNLYGVKAEINYDCPVIIDSAHLVDKNQCKDSKDITVFSFYSTKNLTMGEGGSICFNNDEAAKWFRKAKHHGVSSDGWKRYQVKNKFEYDIEFIGWKLNQSDILTSIGIEQLKKFNKIQKERKRCVELYNKLLGYNNKGLHLFRVLVSDRIKFIKILSNNGISCSWHFKPLHWMTAFKNCKKTDMTNTDYYGKRLVSLPLFPSLKNKEIKYICDIALKTGLLIK